MTIGLLLLGVFSILVFFGVIGNLLKKIGIPDWVAFSTILALTLGVVLAPVSFMGASLSMSGFLVPLVLLAVLSARIGLSSEIFSGIWASILIASLCTLFFLWYPSQLEQTYLYSILLGTSVGVLATMATRRHKAALFGCIGGVLLFELGLGIYDKVHNAEVVYLGSLYTLDVMLIASTVAMVLLEAVGGMQTIKVRNYETKQSIVNNQRLALMTESAADSNLEMIDYYKQQGDYSKIYPEDFVTTQAESDNHFESLSIPVEDSFETQESVEDAELKNRYIGYFGDK